MTWWSRTWTVDVPERDPVADREMAYDGPQTYRQETLVSLREAQDEVDRLTGLNAGTEAKPSVRGSGRASRLI